MRFLSKKKIDIFLILDPAIDGWKTLLNSNTTTYAPGGEINGSGHFELYAPSVQTVIIYDSFADSLKNYYIIDGDSSTQKLTDITNYSRDKDILSFDWAAHGTDLAIYCATSQNWTEVDISTQSLATGTIQWMGEVTVDANNVNTDYILWSWRVTGLNYHFLLHKLSEPKNDNSYVNTSIVSSTDTTITLNVSFVADFMPQALLYKIIPAYEIEGV